jgi:hypothetical protein
MKRRVATRRSILVVGFVVGLLAVFVPGSLAGLGQLRELPSRFISDPNQPANARQVIRRYLARGNVRHQPKLIGIQRVVLTTTPGGEFGVYQLSLTRDFRGIAIISSKPGGVGGLSWGHALSCPAGWALRAGSSVVEHPGSTPVYISGRAAPRVVSVTVEYPSGETDRVALANHYFLAWVLPARPKQGEKHGATRSARIVAHDSTGKTIGELRVSGDGLIPRHTGQSPQSASCG